MLQVHTNIEVEDGGNVLFDSRNKDKGITVEVTYTRKKRRVSCVVFGNISYWFSCGHLLPSTCY